MPGDELKTLAKLIQSRKQDTPYVVLLGSSLSMTSEVLHDLGLQYWNDFNTQMQQRSPNEWHSLLKGPLEKLHLQEGYRCLAQLLKDGYFNVILTANFDSYLEQALEEVSIPSREREVLVKGEHTNAHIIRALKSSQPRIKICLLRGRWQSKTIPNITETLQFDRELEEGLKDLLKEDMIVLGASDRDIDINRSIPAKGGSIWYATPGLMDSNSVITTLQHSRPGGIVTEKDDYFNRFFCTLSEALDLVQ